MDLCENVSERDSVQAHVEWWRREHRLLSLQVEGAGASSLSLSGLVLLAGLEGNLQHAVTQAVAVKASDGHGGFIVIGHGDKAKALTFVGGEVTDDLDIGDGAERPKELPQDALVRLGGQVVDEDAPAGSGRTGQVDPGEAGHAVDGDGRESGEESRRATMGVILKFHATFSALHSVWWALICQKW